MLGLETVQALILSVQIFRTFDPSSWLACHSTPSGIIVPRRWLCQEHGPGRELCREVVDHAFVAGLLHDVGKLVLAVNLPELYKQTLVLAQTEKIATGAAERAIFNTTHAEVGAYLLGLWGLPDCIVEALAYHHNPRTCLHQSFTLLTTVHVANALFHEMDVVDVDSQTAAIDLDYVAQMGLDDRLAFWRERCQIACQPVE